MINLGFCYKNYFAAWPYCMYKGELSCSIKSIGCMWLAQCHDFSPILFHNELSKKQWLLNFTYLCLWKPPRRLWCTARGWYSIYSKTIHNNIITHLPMTTFTYQILTTFTYQIWGASTSSDWLPSICGFSLSGSIFLQFLVSIRSRTTQDTFLCSWMKR